ncbi:MAG: HD domain-containing protein [Pirellulales bacterium]
MTTKTKLIKFSELCHGDEADTFAMLSAKSEAATRDGKPYLRVTFRDAIREVTFPIWNDSAWAKAANKEWTVGECYKLRAVYRVTNFGPQLDIRKIRAVVPTDADDGFDPQDCIPKTRFNPAAMFDQLLALAEQELSPTPLKQIAKELLLEHREVLLTLPAARRNHHAFAGGFLEHVLSVARNAVFLADKYGRDYDDLVPPLCRDLVIAGAILHDIGKVHELEATAAGAEYSAVGELLGHILLGRDMIRAKAAEIQFSGEMLLRLEHIIVSHQRLAEWGSPKPPMTPEAMLVHFADDCDAKFHTLYTALQEPGSTPFTSSKNPLQYKIYRGSGE